MRFRKANVAYSIFTPPSMRGLTNTTIDSVTKDTLERMHDT